VQSAKFSLHSRHSKIVAISATIAAKNFALCALQFALPRGGLLNSLPDFVTETLEKELEGISLKKIQPFVEKLSQFYRMQVPNLPVITTREEHLAYLATRLPATYAAVFEVLRALPFQPHSLLDLGAGPGTAWMAASELFDLTRATLVERDMYFTELGKKLCGDKPRWVSADFVDYVPDEKYDLITISYAIGELDQEKVTQVVQKALDSCTGAVVIVEPGTPRGYSSILRARDAFIEQGANLLAPCPHAMRCPLKDGDWCHFKTRLPRTKIHQYLKGASLGYEDEKFSYIVASKTMKQQARYDRVIREPEHRSGHSFITLCTHAGAFEQKTVSRRDKEVYNEVKRARWGDEVIV